MMTSDNKSPARLHAILAREANKAVVFRRGPSNKTAILEWDLQTDRFKLGQWFYGSLYPYRCDISPDGRHLVYFAAKYGRGSSIDKYIAERAAAEMGEIDSLFFGCPISRRLTFGSTAVDGTAADCSSTTSAWPSTIRRARRV